uniref:hypothetical protein n=1 Tax=Hydrogenophaga sp. TaxID=1904254 RepID=UPI0035663374
RNPPQAWYWVEVFHFNTAFGVNPTDVVLPDKDNHPFIYRITAFVQGQKPGTQVWLRSMYMPRPENER